MNRKGSILFFLVVALAAILLNKTATGDKLSSKLSYVAGLFYAETSTPEKLRADSAVRKVNVLLVPGHTNEIWGTEFNGVKEAELNLALADNLLSFLGSDQRFNVTITRGADGNYESWFSDYVKNHEIEILDWKQKQKADFKKAVTEGFVTREVNIVHVKAPASISRDLYAINKYSNENPIDLVIHIHFNDDSSRRPDKSGKYTGFAIYVPDAQLPNARASTEVAEAVSARLSAYFAKSNYPKEAVTIVPDQDLIAVGANGTQNKAALLIEYGYIYEDQFTDPAVRGALLKELAWQTYLGVSDFFDAGSNVTTNKPKLSEILPYK